MVEDKLEITQKSPHRKLQLFNSFQTPSSYWYLHVTEEPLKIEVSKSMCDEAIFYWYFEGQLYGVLPAHIDDFSGEARNI